MGHAGDKGSLASKEKGIDMDYQVYDSVVNYFELGGREFLGSTPDGTIVKAIVPKGQRFKYAGWIPANEVETRLYKAWREYIDSTYNYDYEFEYE